jgi:O-succinylbenzoic acid--CoA ligase
MTPGLERRLVDRALSVHAAAEDCPARIALIESDGRRWTWSDLSAEVTAVERRLDPGAGVLTATSTPDTIVRILALIERSLPVAPIDPRISGTERQARVDLLEAARGPGAAERGGAIPAAGAGRPLAVMFTSGSTGAPRAVELSRGAFVASARASELRLGWRDDDRWLCVLPLAHVGGLSILIRCLVARRTVVLLERFDAEAVSEVIERVRVTLASFVPTMLSRLLTRDSAWRAPSAVRAVLLGGAPAPDALWSEALGRGLPVLETWGMTETCSQVATAIPGASPRSPVPLPGWNVRSRAGRLEVKGLALLTRYIERGPGSSPLSADGWFSTGDLGTVNPDGSVSISGRADEMIVTGGENVSPFDVERVLESVPGVRRAAVVGLPDAEWGEIVAAALEPDEDRCPDHGRSPAPGPDEQTVMDLHTIMQQQLATFQRPRRIVWTQRLPETSAGKLDRAEVRRSILLEEASRGRVDRSHGR